MIDPTNDPKSFRMKWTPGRRAVLLLVEVFVFGIAVGSLITYLIMSPPGGSSPAPPPASAR